MESKPTLLAVSNAVRTLTIEQTRELVFQLGVPLNVLDDVTSQYDGENRKQHFIQKLLDMKTDTNWGEIVEGLRQIEMNPLAADIERTHLTKAGNLTAANQPVESATAFQLPTTSDSITPTNLLPISAVYQQRVKEVKESIEQLEETFSELKFEAQLTLTKRENIENNFFERFQDYLLSLPVAKRALHIKFFNRNEDEILEAKNVLKLCAILSRYCNYSNYEIIFHVVKRFCRRLLQRMTQYRDSLFAFEKATSIDVYLCAISAHPKGKVSKAFIRMALKINKAPSTCSLYEIRQLKELIAENSSVESYAVYVEDPQEGSIRVTLSFVPEVGEIVGVVLMDPHFRRKTHLVDITVNDTDLSIYLWEDSALMAAVRWGRSEAISRQLESGASLDLQNKLGETALILAAGFHSPEVVSLLDTPDKQNMDGHATLVKAAGQDLTNVVLQLVQAGATLDIQTECGYSALMIAIKEGVTEVVSLLVKAGAALDLQNENGDSALMVAIREDRTEVVSLLLESGAVTDLKNIWGETALIMAVLLDRNAAVSILIKSGTALEIIDKWGDSALMVAVREGKTGAVSILLEAGANTDIRDKNGYSLLMVAAEVGVVEIVTLLIKAGAPINLRNNDGNSVLVMAIRGKTEVVSQLMVAGADLNLQNNDGDSPLMIAFKDERIDFVQYLVEAGASLDLQNKDGDTVLIMATRSGRSDVVKPLLKAGAALNLQNKGGNSAVIVATAVNQLDILKELVGAGADLNLQNEEGLTALIISSRSGRPEVTEILLCGVNIVVDVQTKFGWSALFFAVDKEDKVTTELLLKAGANPHLTDNSGLIALDVAAAGYNDALCELLSNYMQKSPPRVQKEVPVTSQEPPSIKTEVVTSQEKEVPVTSEEPPLIKTEVVTSQEKSLVSPSVQETDVSVKTQVSPSGQKATVNWKSRISQGIIGLVKNSKSAARQALNRLDLQISKYNNTKLQLGPGIKLAPTYVEPEQIYPMEPILLHELKDSEYCEI